jgi:hypothetical protein
VIASGSPAAAHVERLRTRSAGLVHISTSDKRPVVALPIDARLARRRRLKTAVITAARLHDEARSYIAGGVRTKWAFLTLTLRPGAKLEPRSISDLMKHVRGYMQRKLGWFVDAYGFRFVWVMELTKAGVPHYHALVLLPAGRSLPKPDKQGWWKLGMTKIEWARNAVGYIAKYASKADAEHQFPRGMRVHGCGGLDREQMRERRWWLSPKFFRDAFGADADIRIVRGGRLNRVTGEFLPAQWRVIVIGGSPHLVPRSIQ